jgi:2-C-methyl-D-erythritol 4-phosphate cytidylyltransferase
VDDVWGVVVAAGSGTRFGRAKQFVVVGDKPVVEWSVSACREALGHVVVVLPPGATDCAFGADLVVAGGATRSASVRNGLDAVPPSARVVVVHDAARPLARPDLFRDVVDALHPPEIVGAVCAVPLADTVKRIERSEAGTFGGRVVATLDREELVIVQTPQAFLAHVLRRAHQQGGDATDDAALVEAIGGVVRVVAGDPRNVKLTGPEDLPYFEQRLGS